MMQHLALIAEPDPEIQQFLIHLLNKEGMEATAVSDGHEALKQATTLMPRLIILEIVLPGIDGVELCIELRSKNECRKTLIVFYTKQQEDYCQVAAFNAGADDYIIKPVKASVLAARLRALFKRNYFHSEKKQEHVNGLFIDREQYIVFKENERITFPRKEFELLALMHSSPRKVFTRQELSDKIWGHQLSPKNRTIDVHIRKLREKLGDNYIKTVKGVGYSLEL